MKVKIGEKLEHGGQEFVIVNVKHEGTMDGFVLIVTAFDPNMADKEQQKAIKVDMISNQVMDLVKKAVEAGSCTWF